MTTTAPPTAPPTTIAARHRRLGAPLLPPAVVYAVLTVVGAVVPFAAAGTAPWSSDSALLDFFQHHQDAAHASAFFLLGSAIPLAVVTAVATTRLRTLGLDVPGRIIAQVGGAVAAAMLAVSGLATFALTRPHVSDSAPTVRALYALAFATGGPGFVVFSGLLVAGVSIAGLLGRVLPRALGWAGIAVAIVSEVASLTVVTGALDATLPVARFGGLLWLVAVGAVLPATRKELRARRGITRAVDMAG